MENTDTYGIGRSGRFNVDSRFATLVKPRVVYTVRGVNFLTELLREHKDMFAIMYKIANISEEEYRLDIANDVSVVTLVDSANKTVYIPINRIIGGCIRDGVDYVERTLIIGLGGFPIKDGLTQYISNVVDLTKSMLGVTPKLELVESSIVEIIPTSEHESITLARDGNDDTNSDIINMLRAQLATSNKTISNLECIIKQYNV